MTAQTDPVVAAQAVPAKESDAERNFANLRKLVEKSKQENEELRREISEMKKTPPKRVVDDDDDDDGEPFVDKRTLNKKLAKFESKIDEIVDKRAEERAMSLIEQERRSAYLKENADFDNVMSGDVVQKFAEQHPNLARVILNMPEGFERQKLVYENIKALGAHKKDAEKSIQQTIDQNQRRSLYYQPSGMGNSPYAAVGDFSTQGQKGAYDKMQELKSRLRLG